MTPPAWLNLAALAGVATVLALGAVLIPPGYRSLDVLVALLLLAAATAFALRLPAAGGAGGVQAGLFLMGPAGALNALQLTAAALALYAGLTGHAGMAWALNVVTIGISVIGWSVLQAATNVAVGAMQAAQVPSVHNTWVMQVEGLVPSCADPVLRQQLVALAEQLRYAARDVAATDLPESARVGDLLAALPQSIATNGAAAMPGMMRELQAALVQREQALKALRTRI